jgi:hypothetical protein
MQRLSAIVSVVMAAAVPMLLSTPASAQTTSPLAGVWRLNRSLSEFPRELGFDINWLPGSSGAGQSGGSTGGGGRGRRGSSNGGGDRGGGAFYAPRESVDDARRVQLLTAEARNPPARLTIVDTPAAVTITNELGQSRTLHPDGKQEWIQVEGVPMLATTRHDADRLTVDYHVEQDRDVRYTYSHMASPSQLIVEVEFLDHGAGDKARRVYEPGVATETITSPAAASIPASSTQQTPEKFDARPGAELKGLKTLGILVEDLSQQAVACGLNRDAIETSLAKRLTDGGFTVRKNSDEDSYVYINVMTTTTATGACASRYDAFLYTHATANLSYRDQPVLVQVSLMHRGGIGSSAPSAHAAAVTRGLETYVDLFVTQIRDANK